MFRPTLLFANDDVLTQWDMTDYLTRAGFCVTSACRSQEVLDLLAEQGDYDLLLVDLDLPGAPGCNGVARCWQRWYPLRPIVFTGARRAMLDHPLQSREWFLQFPFTGPALLRTVVSALDASRLAPLAGDMPVPSHPMH